MMSAVNTNKLMTPTKFSMRIEKLAKESLLDTYSE